MVTMSQRLKSGAVLFLKRTQNREQPHHSCSAGAAPTTHAAGYHTRLSGQHIQPLTLCTGHNIDVLVLLCFLPNPEDAITGGAAFPVLG